MAKAVKSAPASRKSPVKRVPPKPKAQPAIVRALGRGRPTSIVPEGSVAGRTLLLLIAIMTFLSAVTLGGVVLVQKSAIGWSAEVGREVTIQIRPVEGEVMESNLRTAVALAEATPGVASARALTEAENLKLLEPWLGAGLDLSAIEVPRLVVVELSDPEDADIAKLTEDLKAVKGASLDTHAAWRQQLNTMAGTIVVSGLLVLMLIVVATVLAIIFATRGTMASNREIVDVLHFIGASNAFIAGEFQGRFLSIGLRGGVIGGVAAIVFFFLVAMAVGNVAPDVAGTQIGYFFGTFALGIDGIIGIAAVVPVIAALTAITSRMTVRRFLTEIS
ncbi:cell division protein FtsX [Youhaiella tibetensis]|uniref:cell division protein FtsX n=1 Tax=Paradevosia tibetensis TaxID=1447062 RepID=UPI000ACD7ED4|nr:ABC transporter permease [Youhaiella tibetensis]GGF42993.1 cell division protein FtsX [Youhaiella tibetensis]